MRANPARAHDRGMRNHRSRNSAMRPLKRLMLSMILLFVGLGLTTTRADRPDQPAPPPAIRSAYSHDVVQVDANMTQQMSIPNANTGAQNHLRDPQLDRSQDENYLRLLERHQYDVDRMLARRGP